MQSGSIMASAAPSTLNAVVIGATGAIGKRLVAALLLAKDKVEKVTVITRKEVELPADYGVDLAAEKTQGRLLQRVEDLDTISDEAVKELCAGSHTFFNCLGTTRKLAGSAEAFRHIDCEIPLRLIKLAKEAGVPHCSVVSSTGASSSSWFLYPKTKGQLEDAVKELKFSYTSIYQPGLLGRETEKRFVEKVAGMLVKEMPVATVAEAMLYDAVKYHSSGSSGGAEANVFVANNAAIYRLVEEQKPKTAPKPEEPEAEEPKTEEPEAEEPKTEEPEAEEPKTEEPEAEEPKTEEPKPEEPKTEETEEPKTEEPEAEEPEAEDPKTEP